MPFYVGRLVTVIPIIFTLHLNQCLIVRHRLITNPDSKSSMYPTGAKIQSDHVEELSACHGNICRLTFQLEPSYLQ
ncbi:hypothetical protein BJX99DRAFT_236250 [Aspergillus californicus]